MKKKKSTLKDKSDDWYKNIIRNYLNSIKKADLLNRWTKNKSWNSRLTFTIDDIEYEINVVRNNNTTKVKLIERTILLSTETIQDYLK